MWKLELDESYFRIYDSKKQIAGYFDPDYGLGNAESEEAISGMLKECKEITAGWLMVPCVKFNLFDSDLEADISAVKGNVAQALARLESWEGFLAGSDAKMHAIRISHTDQDMLAITMYIKLPRPTRLHKDDIAVEIGPMLDRLQNSSLL